MGLTEVNQCELESNITLAKVFSPIIIGNDFLRLKTLKTMQKRIFVTMGGPEKGRVSDVI